MPHVLRRYISRIEGLSGFVERAAGFRAVQGVVLDVNPVWWISYRFARAGVAADAWYRWPGRLLPHEMWQGAVEGDDIDFAWLDKTKTVRQAIELLREDHGYSIPDANMPFLVKVICRPTASQDADRERLVRLVTEQPFLAIVETRPDGRLAAAPGDACVSGGSRGTIGGFLRDGGSTYAATCGHVVGHGNGVSVAGTHVGTCTYSRAPLRMSPGHLCTSGSGNKLDFALIDVGGAAVANTVTGVAPVIAPTQRIVLRGGVSGVNTFEVGGTLLTYCPGSSNVCFEHLFEVRPILSAGVLHPVVALVLASVPTQGDSGAWVETQGSQWCGVLVAADYLMGYALEADDVLREADGAFGTSLSVV